MKTSMYIGCTLIFIEVLVNKFTLIRYVKNLQESQCSNVHQHGVNLKHI